MLNSGPTKPFKDYPELLEILKNRGLSVPDDSTALDVLRYVGYYRLSAYSLTLRKDDRFYPDVTFDNICELYRFDAAFREIVLRYCFIVETSFRNYIAHYHAGKYGPLGYLNATHFDDIARHSSFILELDKEIGRSDDAFIAHHINDRNSVFPLWVALEVSSFGNLSKMFKNMLVEDRNNLSRQFVNRSRKYVENWLQCCSYCRNIAAHGGRFYNRSLKSCQVRLNKKVHAGISPSSPFAFIIAIHGLIPSRQHRASMVDDFTHLFETYPFALKKHLGFPANWEDYLPS